LESPNPERTESRARIKEILMGKTIKPSPGQRNIGFGMEIDHD